MGIIESLSELALRQLMGDGAQVVLRLVNDRFTDKGQRVLEALHNANKRAWQTLEVALAGTSWWDQVKKSLAPREDQAFAHELQSFLDATPLAELAGKTRFREQCRRELQQARKQGIIPGGRLSAGEVARAAAGWARHADAQAVRAAEAAALSGIARQLERQQCRSLAWLVRQRPHGGPPLLVLAVRYFFRREVEADAEVAHGLTFQQIEGLSQAQAQGFDNLGAALAEHRQRVEELINVARDTHNAVLDVRAELQRLGQEFQAQFRGLLDLLEKRQMLARPVRPGDSRSIQTDRDREQVGTLVGIYRGMPESKRRAAGPALPNSLGQLQIAVGDFEGAQRDCAAAATLAADPRARAEAHFNAYWAAVEARKYGDALAYLKQALDGDPIRFAPFPLDDYEPQSILGAGGFGVTFLCRDRLLHGPVAVKALSPDDAGRSAEAVFREAAALDLLHHPGIIQLRRYGYADAARTRPFVAMEYFTGQTLEQHVRTNGPVPPEDFLKLARAVADALAAAHGKGILHRDVKPANLLVRKAGDAWEVRLIDFGLALRQAVGADACSTVRSAGVTGTLDYAAPEQLGKLPGVAISTRSDVYGFGRTCCYALFGTPQPSYQQWQTVTRSLATLLDRCLAETPAQRAADFSEVLELLSKVRLGKPSTQKTRPNKPGKGRNSPPARGTTPPGRTAARLVVLRGLRLGVEYPLCEGPNLVGRAGEHLVDVDLTEQEAEADLRSSRMHARITVARGRLTIEDLKSANGTFVNRVRVPPEQQHPLRANDVIQIGRVQLQLKAGSGCPAHSPGGEWQQGRQVGQTQDGSPVYRWTNPETGEYRDQHVMPGTGRKGAGQRGAAPP
jgi:serine/threonine protein kinase